MNAVRGYDGVGNRYCAIGKGKSDAVLGLIQSDQSVAQLDTFVRNCACQSGVQISTMREQIGCAKLPFRRIAEDHVEFNFAGAPILVFQERG
jgi:hypothetical protein